MSNKIKGKYGEDFAAQYLANNGYKIVERNYRFSRYGEIDIIALDKNTLCFIEVKTRTSDKFGTPLEAVTKDKLSKILKCGYSYLQDTKISYKNFRVDAISVSLKKPPDVPEISHIKNIEF